MNRIAIIIINKWPKHFEVVVKSLHLGSVFFQQLLLFFDNFPRTEHSLPVSDFFEPFLGDVDSHFLVSEGVLMCAKDFQRHPRTKTAALAILMGGVFCAFWCSPVRTGRILLGIVLLVNLFLLCSTDEHDPQHLLPLPGISEMKPETLRSLKRSTQHNLLNTIRFMCRKYEKYSDINLD